MCTKIKGKHYSKKFNVTSNINYLPSHSLFIPPWNISTHNGNPFQNKSFHGASSGSILVLNNPRNIDQPSMIRIFQIIFVLFIPPLNISTHNGNPFQNKSFHGAISGSILVLNNPRNIDQPSIIRILQIIFVFDDSTIMLDWFLVHL